VAVGHEDRRTVGFGHSKSSHGEVVIPPQSVISN
jgi:hypothetical protein